MDKSSEELCEERTRRVEDAIQLSRSGVEKRFKRRPGAEDLLDELRAVVKREGLIEPAVAREVHPIAGVRGDGVHLANGVVLSGPLLASRLTSAAELAVMVCTIGPGLEKRVSHYFAHGRPLHGLLLDDIGNAALLSLTREACELIRREASSRGCGVSAPLSPGMSGWPLSEQRHLLLLVPVQQVGVSLTSSAMMAPRKSVSIAIGIGPEVSGGLHADVCSCCGQEGDCAYKVTAAGRSSGG